MLDPLLLQNNVQMNPIGNQRVLSVMRAIAEREAMAKAFPHEDAFYVPRVAADLVRHDYERWVTERTHLIDSAEELSRMRVSEKMSRDEFLRVAATVCDYGSVYHRLVEIYVAMVKIAEIKNNNRGVDNGGYIVYMNYKDCSV